nr:hypothetical protein [Paraburkholderia sp. MMS20-SJTN17]
MGLRCRRRRGARLGSAGRTLVAEAARRGWQRIVEAPCGALPTLGAFAAACGAFAGLAPARCPVTACATLATFVAGCARRTLGTFAVAAFYLFREASPASLTFEAARRVVAACASITAATLLRRIAIAAEAGTIGGIALAAHRMVASRAFRRTACAGARAAERAAFAVVATRRTLTKTARRAIAAFRMAFEPARCAFALGRTFKPARCAFATLCTAFETTWRAFALACTLEPARCAFATLCTAFETSWRAFALARTLKPARRTFSPLAEFAPRCAFTALRAAFKPARRTFSPLTRLAPRCAFATLCAAFVTTRRAFSTLAPIGASFGSARRPRARRLRAAACRCRAFALGAALGCKGLRPCRRGRLSRRRAAGADWGAFGRRRPRMLRC